MYSMSAVLQFKDQRRPCLLAPVKSRGTICIISIFTSIDSCLQLLYLLACRITNPYSRQSILPPSDNIYIYLYI